MDSFLAVLLEAALLFAMPLHKITITQLQASSAFNTDTHTERLKYLSQECARRNAMLVRTRARMMRSG